MDWLIELESMDPEALTNAVLLIATVAGAIAAAAENVRKKTTKNAVRLIRDAEQKYADREKAGADKHAYVVKELRGQVPRAFRPIFPEKRIAQVVDSMFKEVKDYAELKAQGGWDTELPQDLDFPQDTGFSQDMELMPEPDVSALAPAGAETFARAGGSTARTLTVRGRRGLLFRVRYDVCRRGPEGERAEPPGEIERW